MAKRKVRSVALWLFNENRITYHVQTYQMEFKDLKNLCKFCSLHRPTNTVSTLQKTQSVPMYAYKDRSVNVVGT
jgi:hypothetical protein